MGSFNSLAIILKENKFIGLILRKGIWILCYCVDYLGDHICDHPKPTENATEPEVKCYKD